MNKINAIFSDIDGTILKKSCCCKDSFSSKTLASIKEMSNKNMPLILSSGRALYKIIKVSNYIEKKIGKNNIPYLISLNGAIIFDNINKKIIESTTYSNAIKNNVCEYLEGKQFDYFLVDTNNLLHCKPNWFSRVISNIWFIKYTKTYNEGYEKVDNVQKIIIFTKKPHSKSLKKEIEGIFEDVYVSCFGNHIIEIIDKNINKFFALEKVSKLLNINVENVAAVGNEGNDLMMIQHAGFGSAVDFYKNLHLSYKKEKIDFFTANTHGNAFFWTWEYLKHIKRV